MSVGRALAWTLGALLLSLGITAVLAYVAFWALYTLTGYYIPYNVWTVLAFWVGWFAFSILRGVKAAVEE